MKSTLKPVAALTLALSWSVFAQMQSPMREGNWEVTVKMNVPGMGMDVPPMKQTQCVTAAMIKDPQGAIPKGPGGGDCAITNYKLAASTATYTLTCKEPPITGEGIMKYSGSDAYTGTLKVDMGGGQMMTIEYDSKRIGECSK
jgi:Protein of unknown function (DUF3617)